MGRNLVKFKKMMMSSPILKYDVIIVSLMPHNLRSRKSLCFFVFEWITLEFGVRANFRLLISSLD